MIEKMEFITLTGPESDIDRMASRYLSKYEIHLENAVTELSDVKNLTPFVAANPYRDLLAKISEYTSFLPEDETPDTSITVSEAARLVEELKSSLADENAKRAQLVDERKKTEDSIGRVTPFRGLPMDIEKLIRFHYVDFRFGRMPQDYYEKFRSYVYENFNTIFLRTSSDESYVYGIEFTPLRDAHKLDAVYSSMHFERIYVPDGLTGSADEIYDRLIKRRDDLDAQISACDERKKAIISKDATRLAGAKANISELSDNFDIRKYAAVLRAKNDVFYILCGWIAADDIDRFRSEISSDPNVTLVVEDAQTALSQPPTKLKNPKLFRPYEMYVEMYGLPNYRELDPTIFIAVTYSFIFGAMFGDFGQGLVLLIGGLLLYKMKGVKLAGIISCAGVFSTFFGLMFGSFFGFEDTVIKHVWLKPKDDTMYLPGIGNINTVLVVAIVFGMFLILVTMILNIINSKRLGDKEGELFGTNSIAGFLFYTGVILFIFKAFGAIKAETPAWLEALFIIICFIIPLVLMFCKEPLGRAVEGYKGPKIEDGVGMFIVQSFFEMFETLLSFFSNTLSFVRIGAFAVSHAAMMEVVLMLAGADSGTTNWVVIILGNVFVMGMEGLIVGIQVLRLEYYEMFSRFYHGDGKPFRPFRQKKAA